jgi:sporulation protein YhbH
LAVKEQDWTLSPRGLKDAARHREKVKEVIRRNITEIISNEAIITRKRGQIVKVPVRGLKSYRFIYQRSEEGGVGIGQGEGKKGDLIGRQPRQGRGKPGQAGDEPGVDYLETEIDIEELVQMMLQDLGLPDLRQKEIAETIIPRGWTFDSIEKVGPAPHLDKKRTLRAAIRRTESVLAELMATGAARQEAEEALRRARGDVARARHYLLSGLPGGAEGDLPDLPPEWLRPRVRPHTFVRSEDLRYRTLKEDIELQSNAVILAMMDVSGSMGTMKKYLARSFYFWMANFLRHIYRKVEIRFIVHTTEAKLVDEYEFFHKGESGGTFCHSAFDLALRLVENEYSPQRWNIYPFYFSDGEDLDAQRTVESARKLMGAGINMLGYGEIQVDYYTSHKLVDAFRKGLDLVRVRDVEGDFEALRGRGPDTPFVGVVIKDKTHVYPALKEFLRKDRKFSGARLR